MKKSSLLCAVVAGSFFSTLSHAGFTLYYINEDNKTYEDVPIKCKHSETKGKFESRLSGSIFLSETAPCTVTLSNSIQINEKDKIVIKNGEVSIKR